MYLSAIAADRSLCRLDAILISFVSLSFIPGASMSTSPNPDSLIRSMSALSFNAGLFFMRLLYQFADVVSIVNYSMAYFACDVAGLLIFDLMPSFIRQFESLIECVLDIT